MTVMGRMFDLEGTANVRAWAKNRLRQLAIQAKDKGAGKLRAVVKSQQEKLADISAGIKTARRARLAHPEMTGAMVYGGLIHTYAAASENPVLLGLAAVYNDVKDQIGLGEGLAGLIAPSKGREIYYRERAAYFRQQEIDRSLSNVMDLGTPTEASPQALSDKLWGQNDVATIMPAKVMPGFVLPGSTAYREIYDRLPAEKKGFERFIDVSAFKTLGAAVKEIESLWPVGLKEEIQAAIARLEAKTGKLFGKDLFVSVRGAPAYFSPGAMDTILNVGFNLQNVREYVKKGGETAKWALDCYRRLIAMVAISVFGLSYDAFNRIVSDLKLERGIADDDNLRDVADLQMVVERSLKFFKQETGFDFPDDPWQVMALSINAAFRSHFNPEAVAFRDDHGLPDDVGPSVGVQQMAFGNLDKDTLTGVAFTRDVATGKREMVVEWLGGSQGEDVVAGIRRVKSYKEMCALHPEIARELEEIGRTLEKRYGRMQEIEFTVQRNAEGKQELKVLQRRTDKDLGAAAVQIAVDLVDEGVLTKEAALLSVRSEDIAALLFPYIKQEIKARVVEAAAEGFEGRVYLGKGLAGAPGAFSGIVVMSKEEALEQAAKNPGISMIMVREVTSPDDNPGILISQTKGLVTTKGGLTAHASVVARGAGKACVPSVQGLEVHEAEGYFLLGGQRVEKGQTITIDGHHGDVYLGNVPTEKVRELPAALQTLLGWADEYRKMEVRVNADTKADSEVAAQFGAEGNGLLRTEHTMFNEALWPVVQSLILAENIEGRREPLAVLKNAHKQNFRDVYLAMAQGKTIPPVNVRLLDPPLHEFVPDQMKATEIYYRRLLADAGQKQYRPEVIREDKNLWEMPLKDLEALIARVKGLHEVNPMLGLRGVRLGILMPEIYRMQVEALFETAAELTAEGYEVVPEVEIPLVGIPQELDPMLAIIEQVGEEVAGRYQLPGTWGYNLGTMIELPAAALNADVMARTLRNDRNGEPRRRVKTIFQSYGTNDLTQTTMGLSRDDAAGIISEYLTRRLYGKDPFVTIHPTVQAMVRIGVGRARASGLPMEIGVCGEHGGDPDSGAFFYEVGMDFVSCSPFRVPGARLGAAQAFLISEGYHLQNRLAGR
jgi:pyruvate,orthophosphate dikinase